MLTVLVTCSVSPNAFYTIAAILTMINRTWVQISQYSSGVGAWRLPAASSINGHELLEEGPVTNFIVLPFDHENEAVLEIPLNILTAPFRRRDKFTTRSTWLAQSGVFNDTNMEPRCSHLEIWIFSCLLYPPVSCSLSSCRLRDAMKVGNIRPQKIVSPYATRSTCLSGLQTFRVPSSSFLNSERAKLFRRSFSQYAVLSCQDVNVVTSD